MRPSRFAVVAIAVALLASNAAWSANSGFHGSSGYHGGYGHPGYRGGYGYYGRGYGYGYGGVRYGFYFGGPWWGWPGYYPYSYAPYYAPYSYPYYYDPQYTVTTPAPPAYVENQAPAPSSPPAEAYWYYCRDSQSYYPYVRSCKGNWEPVSPQPPPPAPH
jgi:hypothetical protein